jgi:thioredoxin-dependent peroxiredoxin
LRRVFVICFVAGISCVLALVTVRAAGNGPPAVGQTAPEFSLPSQSGTTVSLASYRGKYVVLFFYPKDAGSGSTAEAKAFQSSLAQYEKYGQVLGISEDPLPSHKRFAARAGITFPLLSDTGGKVAAEYGSAKTLNGAPVAARNTFLIDPQGKIAKVWTNVTSPATHPTAVMDDLSVKPPIVH